MGRGSVSAFSSHLARILGLACGLAACSLPSLLVAQAGATVALPELGRTTLTDDLGRFEFRDVPAGSHRVLVSYHEPSAVSIRGMASRMNAVTMDGALLAPVSSGATRQVRFTTNSTAQFEEFEVELLCREWTAGIPLEYNGTSATVAWSKGADLSSLVGRTLSLEFRSTRTKLYSFRFE